MSGGSRTRVATVAGWCLKLLGHGHVLSKDGRSRTLWACFGGRLLSREHVPGGGRASPASCPGRSRTCTRLVNGQPHDQLCFGTIVLDQFRRLGSNQLPPRFQRGALTK